MEPGSTLTLDVEKPAAGGRMLARHEGHVVLVWGAIPGERVSARVDRISRGVVWAEVVDVLSPSADRKPPVSDWRCGGNVYAHVAYERQRALKGEIIQDAMVRIGRIPLPVAPVVVASPDVGYRMRARLHVQAGRVGFYREGTHEVCDAGATGQLLPETAAWISRLEKRIGAAGLQGIASLEIAENIPASERACHIELQGTMDVNVLASLSMETGLTGLTASRLNRPGVERLSGVATVTDVLHVTDDTPPRAVRLRRNVRSFFQANRFLLAQFVRGVIAQVPAGPVVDLYAGVGLFGLSIAAAGGLGDVTLVEGDPMSGVDLSGNAEPFADRVRVHRTAVEEWLRSARPSHDTTFIVDPPRTGLSREAVAGILAQHPARIVYVSCDTATLARDMRACVDAGYELQGLAGFDLFPNTAHVETVATLVVR